MKGNKLPDPVVKLLKTTRFLDLATCHNDIPHVSLMNYTYYHGDADYIIFTTSRKTTKFANIQANPNVSILVHDWVSTKPVDINSAGEVVPPRRNSLYELLANLNKSELSRVSVMISGTCDIIDKENDPERFEFYKSLHANNAKIDETQVRNYIECADNALVILNILGCKVTDTDDNVEEY